MIKFGIVITHDRRKIRLQVEQISDNGIKARYKVIARNTSLVLETNKPLLLSKGLKHKKPSWSIIEGKLQRSYYETLIIKEIEKRL